MCKAHPKGLQIWSGEFFLLRVDMHWVERFYWIVLFESSISSWTVYVCTDLIGHSNQAMPSTNKSDSITTQYMLSMAEILHHRKDGWNPLNHGINHLSTGAGLFPSTVCARDKTWYIPYGYLSLNENPERNGTVYIYISIPMNGLMTIPRYRYTIQLLRFRTSCRDLFFTLCISYCSGIYLGFGTAGLPFLGCTWHLQGWESTPGGF